MLSRNVQHLQRSFPVSAAEAPPDQGPPYGMAKRRMGPPSLTHPQPVEIDPYHRLTLWEPIPAWASVGGEPSPLFPHAMNVDKSLALSVECGSRNGGRDPFMDWFAGKTQPWIPKGAVPEVGVNDRPQARGYLPGWREMGDGHPLGSTKKPERPVDTASVHFGVLASDSGYGSAIGLESASTRGSDVVDYPSEIRSRIASFQPYGGGGFWREAPQSFPPWSMTSTNPNQLHCRFCNQHVRNKSELKKHEKRHTKPFVCPVTDCPRRTEGFSTTNDLERHMKSIHPNECPEEVLSKTYYCPVSGCKSKDKKWPRLDNFRSHLRRLHNLSAPEIEHCVQRIDVEREKRNEPLPPGPPSGAHKGLDQEQLPCLDSSDGADLSYEINASQWSHISPAVLNARPDLIDPILQDGQTETVGMAGKVFHFELDDKPGEPDSRAEEKASDKANISHGCLTEQEKIQSNHMSIKTMTSPTTKVAGSSTGAADSDSHAQTGNVSKPQKVLKWDPDLRDVITTVLSKASMGNDAERGLKSTTPQEERSSDMVHSPRTSPSKTDSELSLPIHEALLEEDPDDQATCSGSPSTLDADKKNSLDADQRIQELLRAIQNAGYTIKKNNKPVNLNQPANQSGSNTAKKREIVFCDLCPIERKFSRRPCELRKHMKRHVKPYGCTFPKCLKTFGSKNDWKRHENSQHYQHETWRCDGEIDGKPCNKVFYTADSAKSHFTKVHKVEGTDALERQIAAHHIGPNHQREFWCGFCEKIVNLGPTVEDPWTERFNHIDIHFMGRKDQPKKCIAQWKSAEPDDEELPKDPFSRGGAENGSSGDLSSSSSETSAGSSDASSERLKQDADSASLDPRKRKGIYSDGSSTRPSKQPKSGKVEPRIICCQCQQHYNPKTDTACTNDDHRFCDQCQRGIVVEDLDPCQ